MKQSLVSGLGGTCFSPNLSSYGHLAPPSVCRYLRALVLASLFLLFVHLAGPTASMAASSATPPTNTPSQTAPTTLTKPKVPKPAPASHLQPSKVKARGKQQGAAAKKNIVPHADTWAFSTQKPRPVDTIWTQGMAPQALKNASVIGLKNKAITTGLSAPAVPPVMPPRPQTPKQNLQNKSRGMQLRGDVDSINSSWHSSGLKHDLRIDQDMNRLETNIYGAYADIEAGEDLTLSAGPEFSHTRTQSATHGNSHTQTETGSLGLGFHLKWDF